MKTSNCPACSAPLHPQAESCEYCGQYIQRQAQPGQPPAETSSDDDWEPVEEDGLRLPAWTQGISDEGWANGSYDLKEYPTLHLAEANWILENMPIPPQGIDPSIYCQPALGFGERNISRNPDGSYFLWPEDRFCTLEEAKQVIQGFYPTGG